MLALSGLDFRPIVCARTTLDHRDYASTLLLARCRRQHCARTPTTHPARSSRLVQVLISRLGDAYVRGLRYGPGAANVTANASAPLGAPKVGAVGK